ncbi:MAG: hypothetical protein ACR2FY_22495 [Pirellulaceae bacterium]
MKRTSLVLTGVCLVLSLGSPSIASAQPPTTVQLPTFSFFTVNTSVSVPDSGGTYLGGLLRGRDSSSTRGIGLLANRGIGSERSAGGMSVRAWIHDFRKLDEALLAEAAGKGREADPAALKGVALAGSLETGGRSPGSEAPLLSVADIRRQNDQQDQAQREAALAYFTKAEEYRTAGKLGLANLNYQRAAARDAGKVKEAALKRIAQLQNPPAVTAKVQDEEKER